MRSEPLETISPEELVLRCQRTLPDDTRAFEALVTQYKTRVYALAYRLMGNREEAEDQAQEVFLKIFRSIKDLDEPEKLTSWIYRITTNTCLDALNKRKKQPVAFQYSLADGKEDEFETMQYADTSNLTPEETAMQKELYRCLQRTLARLDADGRAVIVLRDIEGFSYQEIANQLALQLSAVKMRIHRARLAFQQLLDQICPGAWRQRRVS